MRRALPAGALLAGVLVTAAPAAEKPLPLAESVGKLESELTGRYGSGQREAISRGLSQVAAFWREGDGDAAAFEEFARDNFAGDPTKRDALFERMELAMESLDGHMLEIGRDFRAQTDLDRGPIYPFDQILAGYDPAAHVNEDFFANKLGFVVLLNFPLTTLEQKLAEGERWSRRQWAEARLADRFSKRVPAEVNLAIGRASAEAEQYIAEYNLWMHHLVDASGRRLFPGGMRLLSHWNLRDEIRADYGDAAAGLAKQRLIAAAMERIVTQTIPAGVVDNPNVDWDPVANRVTLSDVHDSEGKGRSPGKPDPAREPDTRYAMLAKTFQAARLADPYSPTAPTLIDRRFQENRQIPEERVRRMLEAIVGSPLVSRVAARIQKRLGRPLEPFDIWYSGFRPKSTHSEPELDRIVRAKYPTADAYRKDIPRLLGELGFSPEKAAFLAANIVVDPARGSGHAMGAARRGDQSHLRTRVEKEGMNYKGFNIAVHEMGHNVEQTFSLNSIDHTLLAGVPNTAFTEALAFVFQARDLELLGLSRPTPEAQAVRTLNAFWSTYEISGVALVDMGIWHWMYAHPTATASEVKDATLSIARDVWNRYYAPAFGRRDVVLLAIYSHMIDSFLYLPDYPLGHMIAFQIERQFEKAGRIGPEFERMATMGNVLPDLWMKHATGSPVGPEALLAATEKALAEVRD